MSTVLPSMSFRRSGGASRRGVITPPSKVEAAVASCPAWVPAAWSSPAPPHADATARARASAAAAARRDLTSVPLLVGDGQDHQLRLGHAAHREVGPLDGVAGVLH